MNEIFWSWEKQGGNNTFTQQMEDFRNTIIDLSLLDLGFVGDTLTWTNGRAGIDNIQIRLDRAFANPLWRLGFPEARVIHLPRYKSDHSPILIECNPLYPTKAGRINKKKRLFHFEKMWLENDTCANVVASGWDRGNNDLSFVDRTKRCEDFLGQ
ncbi:hypothetical protein ACS0TY_006206 [Phlomoides rotata]